MRSPSALALVLGLTGVATACGGDGSGPSNALPTAAFVPSCASLVCTFADGSSDADGQVTAYSWDFGDGAVSGTSKDAQHTYAAANTYGVTLTVTDNGGATNRVTKTVQVSAPANPPQAEEPSADFAGSCVGVGRLDRVLFFDCTFTDQSTAAAGATVTAWAWVFGDGTTSTEQNPVLHHYTKEYRSPLRPVSFTVSLSVTDNNGLTNKVTKAVPVSAPANIPPAARFTSACADLSCSFTDLSSDDDGTVVGFHWNFGDGSVVESQNSTHSYASAGTYVVELTVTDDSGATGILSQPVTVTGAQTAAPPTISIGVPYGLVRYGLCYPALVGPSVRGCRSSAYLSISNTGGGTLNWTATKDATWLRISPKSGAAPSTMAVWVNATGVPPGSYYGHITVSAPGATNSPQMVTVRFTRY
jgi:PKD repeat protein